MSVLDVDRAKETRVAATLQPRLCRLRSISLLTGEFFKAPEAKYWERGSTTALLSFFRYLLVFALLATAARPSENVDQLISEIKGHVREQLVKSSNYACVETIERKYLRGRLQRSGSCDAAVATDLDEILSDRLRLDLAVSQGREIFSWHGASEFSSSRIADVVGSGVVSSGNFVGFLRNIFLPAKVEFTLKGRSRPKGREIFRFEYAVGKDISRYRIGDSKQSAVVPFHGSFTVYGDTRELAELTVLADHIPPAVDLCAAETRVHFQMADISGRETLIPSRFELKTVSDRRIYTLSRGDYADCHEFQTESKLRFDTPDAETGATFTALHPVRVLPPGLGLHVALTSAIDSRTAFTGDPVEASLTEPLSSAAEKIFIPRGAILHGAITQLELHSEKGGGYWYVRVEFERLDSGNDSFLLRAIHTPSGKEEKTLSSLYRDDESPESVAQRIRRGTMVFSGYHLRLDKRFRGDWHTLTRAGEMNRDHPAVSQ